MADISKLNVAGQEYDLKDADSRTKLATLLNNKAAQALGTAAFVNTANTVSKDGINVPTEAAVATAIANAVKDLEGAIHFRGVFESLDEITDPKSGDVAIVGVKEYIYDGSKWNELGDETIYLTIATAQKDYVQKTTTIAGIDLQDNITAAEVKEALDLDSMAYAATASGKISTIDSIDDITVAKAGEYTVSGTAVSVPQTYSELDVTPAGSVEVKAGTAAAATYQKANSATISAVVAGDGQTANYTPAGSVTLPSFTSTVTPTKEAVATVTSAGTGYTITDGSVSKGTDTTDNFATAGVVASVEDEVLIFTAATTAAAVTSSAEPQYTAPVLSGALPTFGTKDVMVSATVATAKDGDATFSGTGAVIGASLGYETADATVTQPTFTAEFSGTSKAVTPTVATSANAAPSDAKITIATEAQSVTVKSTQKTVTVSPDAK